MKKIVLFFILSCLQIAAFAQATAVFYAAGSTGTYTTGSSTLINRFDNTIVSTGSGSVEGGYAVFNLSSIPAGSTITSVSIGYNVISASGASSNCKTYGFAGDLSTIVTPSTIFSDLTAGTLLSTTASYGAVGSNQLASNPTSVAFVSAHIGGSPITTISICFTGGGAATYNITGESGTVDTNITHAHVPFLVVNYCPPPVITAATATPNPVCNGSTFVISGSATISGSGSLSYFWTGPSSYASAVATNSITASSTTAGVYTLVTTNTCGTVTATSSATTPPVVVNANVSSLFATASVSSGHLDSLCVGANLTLSGTASGGSGTAPVYSWAGPGTYSSAGLTPPTISVLSSNAGIYTLTSTVPGCTNVTATTPYVYVFTAPSSATASATPNPVCAGSTLTLTCTPSSANSYSWTGPGFTSSLQNPTITGITNAASGTYSVTITNICGSATVTTPSVSVVSSPTVTATASPNPVCNGSLLTLTGAALTSAPSTYSWIGPLGSFSSTVLNPAPFPVTIAGIYTLSVTTPGCSTVNAVTSSVSVNAAPASITGSHVICVGSVTSLSETTTLGTWSSSNNSIASITSSGILSGGIVGGVATISYTLSSGCSAIFPVTVITTPSSITPSIISALCPGSTVTLTDSISGGVWTTGNAAVATVNSTTGVVTGSTMVTTQQTTTISYGSSSGGCVSSVVVTVNPLPPAIAPTAPTVCAWGGTTTLTDANPSGYWSSSTAIISTAGVVTGEAPGVDLITYTDSATGCSITTLITVDSLPVINPVPDTVCAGDSILVSATGGVGTWSSSNAGVFSVISHTGTTGMVMGAGSGAAFLTYTLTSTSCYITEVFHVGSMGPILGRDTVCEGGATLLTDTAGGGVWTSSNSFIASVTPLGLVIGIDTGVSIISYTKGACYATQSVTVYPPPASIVGPNVVCDSQSIILTDATSGGTWKSSDTLVAKIESTTGILYGLSAGVDTVTYTIGTGCYETKVITVNPIPLSIVGTRTICAGSTTTLFEGASGFWHSSNTTIATVAATGVNSVLTGLTAGVDTISYSSTTLGCPTTFSLTVLPLPNPIIGDSLICDSNYAVFTSTTTGGVWTATNTTAAQIVNVASDSFLCVLPPSITTLTDTIIYTASNSCRVNKIITINALPAPITGSDSVCVGSTITLADTSAGGSGAWSETTGKASVSSTGVVTGVAAGTDIIYYYPTPFSCPRQFAITVNALPAPIAGPNPICQNTNVTYVDTPGLGGIWTKDTGSLGNYFLTTVNSVTAVILDTNSTSTTINLKFTSFVGGCQVNKIISVNPLPDSITGSSSICQLGTSTLADATPGGFWTVSNTTVASVGGTSGIVYGGAPGLDTVMYELGTGCSITIPITVNPAPTPIFDTSDAAIICGGGYTCNLHDSTIDITWSSANTFLGTVLVDPSDPGHVTVTSGTTGTSINVVNIIATSSNGCSVSFPVTVYPTTAITGFPFNICAGDSFYLTGNIPCGTWSAGGSPAATISTFSPCSDSAILHTVNTGSVPVICTLSYQIDYTILSTGLTCTNFTNITVNPLPAPIDTPIAPVCMGDTLTLIESLPTATGYWQVFNLFNTNALVLDSFSGNIVGLNAGLDTIAYTDAGCSVFAVVTVKPMQPITGGHNLCFGDSLQLHDTAFGGAGGSWGVTDPSVATITSSGVLVAIATVGYTNVTYTTTVNGCIAYDSVNVSIPPASILGGDSVCYGTSLFLSDPSIGGKWFSTNTTIATIDSYLGNVYGVLPGVTSIEYIDSVSGCKAVEILTVDPSAPIIGPSLICVGVLTSYTDSLTGGTWTDSTAFASGVIDPTTGVLIDNITGTDYITYVRNSCLIHDTVTVTNLQPIVPSNPNVCQGQSVTVTDATPGGTWSSANNAIATVNPITGVVYGVASGTVLISYNLTSGCTVVASVIVHPFGPIKNDTMAVCKYQTLQLTDSVGGGVWSVLNTAIATVSSTGLITGVSSGTTNVYYILAGCTTSAIITINQIGAIHGIDSVCPGATVSLTDITPGGTWTTVGTTIAYVGITGVVTGVAPGVILVTYTAGSYGCFALDTVTVLPLPAPISFPDSICAWGGTATAYDATPGGIWSSIYVTFATPTSNISLVTGNAPYSPATITYTLPSGCQQSKIVTVNALPSAIIFPYGPNICKGQTVTLTDDTTGGIWSSSNTSIATVGSASGLITGIDTGFALITYMSHFGCDTMSWVRVNQNTHIVGDTNMCVNETSTFFNPVAGGSWSYSSLGGTVSITTNALHDSAFILGLSGGNILLNYNNGYCDTTILVHINVSPLPYYESDTICAGSTLTLTYVTTLTGTWSSSNVNVATVSATGLITGTGAGLDTITYKLSNGCRAWDTLRVNSLGPILGPTQLCGADTVTFTDTARGGYWSYTLSTGSIIPVIYPDSSIVFKVTGYAYGPDTIIYTMDAPNNCVAKLPITINPIPVPFNWDAGNKVCVGLTDTLYQSFPYYATGATWSLSNTSIATISTYVSSDTSYAYIKGLPLPVGSLFAIDSITFTMPTGCSVTRPITIYANPAPITGPTKVCVLDTIILSDASSDPASYWTSNHPSSASVAYGLGSALGVVTGLSAGTNIITFTAGTGCYATHIVTVQPNSPIVGPTHICDSTTTLFVDATPGGIWTTNKAIGVAGPTTGLVTGQIPTSTTDSFELYYTTSLGCKDSFNVVIIPTPPAITPSAPYVCVGQTDTLHNTVGGGTWSSANPTYASIFGLGPDYSNGVVTGHVSGTVIMSYTFGTGCVRVVPVIVYPLTPITGPTTVCEGSSITLADATPATPVLSPWSEITGNAIVSGTGVVYGSHPGLGIILYSTAHCITRDTITINPLPGLIVGANHVCQTMFDTLSDATTGGTWSIFPPGPYVTITPFGMGASISVRGDTVSTIHITYTLPTGCLRTELYDVDSIPLPIIGPTSVCQGSVVTLSDVDLGGTWSWSPYTPHPGSIIVTPLSYRSDTATVTGILSGPTIVAYSISNPHGSCSVKDTFIVNPSLVPSVTLTPTLGQYDAIINNIAGIDSAVEICQGQSLPITATAYNGGISPYYVWSVNGVVKQTGFSNVFTYSLYNTGDVLNCQMTSDATCVVPNTAEDNLNIKVDTSFTPTISIASSTGPVCQGQQVTFVATSTNGGTAPVYQWLVNGAAGGTNSNTYIYIPNIFDSVTCVMISNKHCALPDTVTSNAAFPIVEPSIVDNTHLYVYPVPGTTVSSTSSIISIKYFTTVNFFLERYNFGWYPLYQWYLNGVPIPGATDSVWNYSNFHNGDYVYCVTWSDLKCVTPHPDTSSTDTIHISDVSVPFVANAFNEVILAPNPNKGSFSLKGNLNTVASDQLDIEIVDLLGKVVFRKSIYAVNGKINTEVTLDESIVNGIYYLRLSSGGETDQRHFVLER